MKLKTLITLLCSHAIIGLLGFALGIYLLPILIAPPAPTDESIAKTVQEKQYSGEFVRDLEDSDRFDWGDGTISISEGVIAFKGSLSPGPDYKLYLSPEFVETEDRFNQLKPSMILLGDVKTFDNFLLNVPSDIPFSEFNSLIVWCETFGEFITAAKYR